MMAWRRICDKPLFEPMLTIHWRIYAALGGDELTAMFVAVKYSRFKNMYQIKACFYVIDNGQVRHHICTHNDSSAIVKRVKFWPDWIIRKQNKSKQVFKSYPIFGYKLFMRWSPDAYGVIVLVETIYQILPVFRSSVISDDSEKNVLLKQSYYLEFKISIF